MVRTRIEKLNEKYTEFYRQMNISQADLDELIKLSKKEGDEEEKVVNF